MGNIASSGKKWDSAPQNAVLNVGSQLFICEDASATDKNVFPRLHHAFSGGERAQLRSGMHLFSGGNAFFGGNMPFSSWNGRPAGCAGHFSPVLADNFATDDCVQTFGGHSEAPTRHLGIAKACIQHGNEGCNGQEAGFDASGSAAVLGRCGAKEGMKVAPGDGRGPRA